MTSLAYITFRGEIVDGPYAPEVAQRTADELTRRYGVVFRVMEGVGLGPLEAA